MDNRSSHTAWNPGMQSQIPHDVLPLSTIFDPKNVFQSFSELKELSNFTGLTREDLSTFKPERLLVHELLIRVSADYFISVGDRYEDLGLNFREMAAILLNNYLTSHIEEVLDCYNALQQRSKNFTLAELEQSVFAINKPQPKPPKKSWLGRLISKPEKPAPPIALETRDAKILDCWRHKANDTETDRFEQHVYQALTRICGSIMHKHGRILGDKSVLEALVTRYVCNNLGSLLIGELITPIIRQVAQKEGYDLLPSQANPIVMNVKGASASGKSTLRPLLKDLTTRLNINWADFAQISPDIWRKFLLDYESLGDAYKYAGACSSHELKCVDQKLDAYVKQKAANKCLSHLLIDRFRFDSFSAKSNETGKHLLTRFGAKVYMFYMITPPHSTVERAWKRGLKVGRYKAVDDLLDHNVEAYTGMPHIFFTWALNQEKDVHYEFLDNSVDLGQCPRTIAFGENGSLTILDAERLMDIDRFRKIDINAKSPETVYPDVDIIAPAKNTEFIFDCIRRLSKVEFADFEKRTIFARIEHEHLIEWCSESMEKSIPDESTRQALLDLFPAPRKQSVDTMSPPLYVDPHEQKTLGAWGDKR